MFRLRRNSEFVLPPKRRHFTSETAKHRGFCEAASLTALGPYGQKAHEPGDLQGDLESPCTRFLWFVSLTCVKEMNNNDIKVRKLCSHHLNSVETSHNLRTVGDACPYKVWRSHRTNGGSKPPPTRFGVLATPQNSSEAASPKSLGPYVENAHNPKGYIGGCLPLCTFSLVRFFGVSQRNEQQRY